MNKHPLKSKTINAQIIIIIIAILSMFGLDQKEAKLTWDTIGKPNTNQRVSDIEKLITIFAGATGIYGRYTAGGKKDEK